MNPTLHRLAYAGQQTTDFINLLPSLQLPIRLTSCITYKPNSGCTSKHGQIFPSFQQRKHSIIKCLRNSPIRTKYNFSTAVWKAVFTSLTLHSWEKPQFQCSLQFLVKTTHIGKPLSFLWDTSILIWCKVHQNLYFSTLSDFQKFRNKFINCLHERNPSRHIIDHLKSYITRMILCTADQKVFSNKWYRKHFNTKAHSLKWQHCLF